MLHIFSEIYKTNKIFVICVFMKLLKSLVSSSELLLRRN